MKKNRFLWIGLLISLCISFTIFQPVFAYDPYADYEAEYYAFFGDDGQDYQALLLEWKEYFSSPGHTHFYQNYDQDEFQRFICDKITERHNNRIPHPYLCGYYTHDGSEITIVGFKASLIDFYFRDTEDDPYYYGKTAIVGVYEIDYAVTPENLVIPDTIDGIPVTAIEDNAFGTRYEGLNWGFNNGFLRVKTLVIGDNVRTIGKYAFNSLRYLESVQIGKNVQSIGDQAFDNAGKVQTITSWGDCLETIGERAFNCVGAYNDDGISVSMPPFPDSLRSIGAQAFYGSRIATSVITIPPTVQEMAADAFNQVDNLEALILLNPKLVIANADHKPIIASRETSSALYCYSGSTAEDNAKRFGYTYYLIDGASLLFDGAAVEGDALRVPTALTEAEFLARAASDGAECEVRLSDLRDGKVTTGTTVTLWNTKVDAAGKVYTVRKDAEVETVSVSALPAKTSYRYKEAFDPTGLALAVTYDDGTTATVSDGFTIEGAENLKVGKNTITVAYADRAATFDVTVKYTWWQYLIRIFLLGFLWY